MQYEITARANKTTKTMLTEKWEECEWNTDRGCREEIGDRGIVLLVLCCVAASFVHKQVVSFLCCSSDGDGNTGGKMSGCLPRESFWFGHGPHCKHSSW